MPIIIPDDLPYTPEGIECLRLGARRGGQGIGCCAIDVFQGFSNDPSSIRPDLPFYNGDDMTPCLNGEGHVHMSGTNEEVFCAYLAHGSFTPYPEADHAFIATLTDEQLESDTGRAWLAILKREGFKWVASVNNSVYSDYHVNHIFIMTRSVGADDYEYEAQDLLSPPPIWEQIPEATETPEERYQEHCRTYKQAHKGIPIDGDETEPA